MAVAKIDDNTRQSLIAVSNADGSTIVPLYADPTTHRLLVDFASSGGTVTSVSVVTANGFAGSVATATTTPAITLTTTVTGILSGNGTAISAASTTGSGAVVLTSAPSISGATITTSSVNGVTLTTGGSSTAFLNGAGSYTSAPVPTTITVANEATDTSCFIGFFTAATGDLGPKTNTNLQFNSNTGLVTFGAGIMATSFNKVAITAPATSATLTIADGKTLTANSSLTLTGTDSKTLTVSNSGTLAGGDAFVLAIAAGKTLTVSNTLTFTGTDASSVAFGTGGTVLYTASTIPLTVGTTTIASGTNTRILYNNSGVLGEYTLTGSGTVVVMQTAPTFATSITTPSVLATANDSGALGASGTAFADLFLASGGVINWAANNSNITHSSGILTVGAGEFRITSANVGTNADSVPTLSSTSTMTNKTLTAPTLGGATSLADGATIKMIVPTVDGTATGPTTSAFVSGYTSSAIGDLVYLDSSGKWQKTDADAASTSSNLLGIALAVAATDAALLVALPGSIVYATAFPTLTIGAPYYVGETAGAIQATIPTGADNVIRTVGYGVHADKLFFLPASVVQVTVA